MLIMLKCTCLEPWLIHWTDLIFFRIPWLHLCIFSFVLPYLTCKWTGVYNVKGQSDYNVPYFTCGQRITACKIILDGNTVLWSYHCLLFIQYLKDKKHFHKYFTRCLTSSKTFLFIHQKFAFHSITLVIKKWEIDEVKTESVDEDKLREEQLEEKRDNVSRMYKHCGRLVGEINR